MSDLPPTHTPLHQLNTLVAGITKVSPIIFDGVQSAINFSIYEGDPLHKESNIGESAKRLIALYESEGESLAFAHFDLSSYSPLWHRVHILKALESLSRSPRSLLLITGLKEAFYSNNRWTPGAKKAYTEAICFVESLAIKNIEGTSQLHILFI